MVKKLINHNWVGLNEKNVIVGNKIMKVYQPTNEHVSDNEDMKSLEQVNSSNVTNQSHKNLEKALSFM